MTQRWDRPVDVVSTLRRRWQSGEPLSAFAEGRAWEPLAVSIRHPSARELSTSYDDARAWVASWQGRSAAGLRVEMARIGGRLVGSNDVPARAWVDSYDALWGLLGVGPAVARFAELVEATREREPALVDWVLTHPHRVLEHASDWSALLGVVAWVDRRGGPEVYLRQIDVPGVDTKFVESHRGILCDLLDVRLPPQQVDRDQPRSEFSARYGLSGKPTYVRLRRLGAGGLLGPGPSELTVRVDDLAVAPVEGRTVVLVENEITYLALPDVLGAVAVLGAGYGLSRLRPLRWLADRDLLYWGDLDTHGFAILDQLRATFPHATSLLMDRTTLLAHRAHWTHEPRPVNAALTRLTVDEAAVYRDLVEDSFGAGVRLEQERVPFPTVCHALREMQRNAVGGPT